MALYRRSFVKNTLLGAASLAVGAGFSAKAAPGRDALVRKPGMIVDVFVDLFCWPFRSIKESTHEQILAKLQRHRVKQAWTGSYESLFHKNISAVNQRLAKACREHGPEFFVPFGTVNPAFPDWEEDFRRCAEEHRMAGLRLFPSYHGYTLEDPRFEKLLRMAANRNMPVQIGVMLEDIRMQHPLVAVPPVNVLALAEILPRIPHARVGLLNIFRHVRGATLNRMIELPQVYFEISNLDGIGGVQLALQGEHWFLGATLPEERLLLGSHAPYYPFENALIKLFEAPLSADQFDALAFRNAERFLRGA